jgi:hypothetical protein
MLEIYRKHGGNILPGHCAGQPAGAAKSGVVIPEKLAVPPSV